LYFMMGQFGYSIVTEFPAIFVLYDHPDWSMIFLAVIFAASAWNGGGYYIEVFGRKFERELDVLRKELAVAQSQSQNSQPQSGLSSPVASVPSSPQMGPKRNMSQPETAVDDADHLVTGSDVISLDSDSHSGMTGSPTRVDDGLQLYDEERKNQ